VLSLVDTCFAFVVAQWLLSVKTAVAGRKAGLRWLLKAINISTRGRGQPVSLCRALRQRRDQAALPAAPRAQLGDLPEREQPILNLRFYGKLTQIEIGRRLGISQMRISRLLTRALAYLRDQLAANPAETRRAGSDAPEPGTRHESPR
jgi:DNA-binding CsgD family transcriptional regulator